MVIYLKHTSTIPNDDSNDGDRDLDVSGLPNDTDYNQLMQILVAKYQANNSNDMLIDSTQYSWCNMNKTSVLKAIKDR